MTQYYATIRYWLGLRRMTASLSMEPCRTKMKQWEIVTNRLRQISGNFFQKFVWPRIEHWTAISFISWFITHCLHQSSKKYTRQRNIKGSSFKVDLINLSIAELLTLEHSESARKIQFSLFLKRFFLRTPFPASKV